VIAVFNEANGRCPNECQFVYEDDVESELSRIANTVAALAGNTPEVMSSQRTVVREIADALTKLKFRLSSVQATAALKTRTDVRVNGAEQELSRIRQTIEVYERSHRQQREQALKESNEAGDRLFPRRLPPREFNRILPLR
jgi:hypothetical protein